MQAEVCLPYGSPGGSAQEPETGCSDALTPDSPNTTIKQLLNSIQINKSYNYYFHCSRKLHKAVLIATSLDILASFIRMVNALEPCDSASAIRSRTSDSF